MSTKLQEYKALKHKGKTKKSFHAWLLPKHHHRHAASGPKVAYARKLINDVNIPASALVAITASL